MSPPTTPAPTHEQQVAALWAQRPRSLFLRVSLAAFALLVGYGLVTTLSGWDATSTARRTRNWHRFTHEVRPRPVRDGGWDSDAVLGWAGGLMNEGGGWTATWDTLAISVLAVVLAALAGLVLALPAARNLMAPAPFGGTAYVPSDRRRLVARLTVSASRTCLVLLRSVPEFILAFLLLDVFGHSAWPAVLALAVHNAGILGRLTGETIENVEPAPPRALRDAGARRMPLALAAVFPAVLGRVLLYVFYRWETCVREATVLGLLNLPSLGRHVDDAVAAGRKDELLFYVLIGAALVWTGDLVSGWVRARVRQTD